MNVPVLPRVANVIQWERTATFCCGEGRRLLELFGVGIQIETSALECQISSVLVGCSQYSYLLQFPPIFFGSGCSVMLSVKSE